MGISTKKFSITNSSIPNFNPLPTILVDHNFDSIGANLSDNQKVARDEI
jgi:hypothetical protein